MIQWLKKILRKRKTQEISETNALHNVLDFGLMLISQSEKEGGKAVFSLVKMLADKITSDHINKLICKPNVDESNYNSFFENIDKKVCMGHQVYRKIMKLVYEHDDCQGYDLEIDLGKDPVIVFPWNRERLVNNIVNVGFPGQPWEEKNNNHMADLYLPMGLTHIYNGNHSAYSGKMKNEGIIHIHDESAHTVHDMTELYPLIQFDGINYVIAGSSVVVGQPYSFEQGCIFEIGRMIAEAEIEFGKKIK